MQRCSNPKGGGTQMNKRYGVVRAYAILFMRFAKADPKMTVIFVLMNALAGAATGAITPALQFFFDRAAEFAIGAQAASYVIAALVVLAGAYVLTEVSEGISWYVARVFSRKGEENMTMEMYGKISRISPIDFENTEILDSINKAVVGKDSSMRFVAQLSQVLFFLIPFYAFLGGYLFIIQPVLAFSLLLVFAPTLLTQVLRSKVFSKVEDASAPVRREFEYYENCMAGREFFKETRVLGAFSYFKDLYDNCLVVISKLVFRASVKSDLVELGMKLVSLAGYIVILLMLFYSLMNGNISVGVFAAVFASVGRMFGWMSGRIASTFGFIARRFGQVNNFLNFMQMPERGGEDVVIQAKADIELKNVSFVYPGRMGEQFPKGTTSPRHTAPKML